MFHRAPNFPYNLTKGLSSEGLGLERDEAVRKIIILRSEKSTHDSNYSIANLQKHFNTAQIQKMKVPFDPTKHRKWFACSLNGKTGDLIIDAGSAGCYKQSQVFRTLFSGISQ